jgi:hypothetical protein
MRVLFNPRENSVQFIGELARDTVEQIIKISFATRLVQNLITYSADGIENKVVGLELSSPDGNYQARDIKHISILLDRLDVMLSTTEPTVYA